MHNQVAIVSDCLRSMSETEMAGLKQEIIGILGGPGSFDNFIMMDNEEQHEQLRTLLAPHELGYRKGTLILVEPALWKAKREEVEKEEAEGTSQETRQNCSLDIIPEVLYFLVLSFS